MIERRNVSDGQDGTELLHEPATSQSVQRRSYLFGKAAPQKESEGIPNWVDDQSKRT